MRTKTLKKYKNALYEEIPKSGVDAGKFRLEEDETEGGQGFIKIIYKGDETLYFEVRNPEDDFDLFQYAYATFSPARVMQLSPGRRQNQWFNFDSVIGAFRTWLIPSRLHEQSVDFEAEPSEFLFGLHFHGPWTGQVHFDRRRHASRPGAQNDHPVRQKNRLLNPMGYEEDRLLRFLPDAQNF